MIVEYDRPMCDWLTLTSYDREMAVWATSILKEMPVTETEKIIVYDGIRGSAEDGSIFCGWGEQGLSYHCMMTLSGALSDAYAVRAIGMVKFGKGEAGCSRIDLQITVPGRGNLDRLATHLSDNGYPSQVTIYRTLSGRQVGDTLYIGSPKSDKRIRLYHKADGTRFEVQYRRDYALSCAVALQGGSGETAQVIMANHMLHEAEKINGHVVGGNGHGLGKIIESLRVWATGGQKPESNGRQSGNTERWIRKTVMSAMVKECAKNPELRRWVLAQLGVSEL